MLLLKAILYLHYVLSLRILISYFENIEKATIKFVVNKTWMNENKFDMYDVKLKRFTNSWQTLDTKYLRNDFWFYYYEAETPGFSYFAIAVDKSEKLIKSSDIIESNKTIENEKSVGSISEDKETPKIIYSNKNRLKLMLLLGIGLVIASAIIVLIIQKRKKDKDKKKK